MCESTIAAQLPHCVHFKYSWPCAALVWNPLTARSSWDDDEAKRRFEKGNRNAIDDMVTHHETEKQRENDVLTLGIIFEPLAIRPRSHLSRCRTSASASDVSFICRKIKMLL
jgi:hypothetical protein